TPIVIPDIGGARDLVTTPEAGRLAERTPEHFAAAIAALLADPPDPQAVRAATQGFTWQANALALRAHLSALVAARQVKG
ncbi:MAG TPA: glycosyltransferase family 4 protein, partial [Sphingomonas sp.]